MARQDAALSNLVYGKGLEGAPVNGRGLELDDLLRSHPTHTILWFYDYLLK